jgi:hypothetical protein
MSEVIDGSIEQLGAPSGDNRIAKDNECALTSTEKCCRPSEDE